MKCLNQGMKREAVQEERQKNKDGAGGSGSGRNDDNMMSPGLGNEELSQAQQSMLDFMEDATLTPSEKQFLDKLIESENTFYPRIENISEAVSSQFTFIESQLA